MGWCAVAQVNLSEVELSNAANALNSVRDNDTVI